MSTHGAPPRLGKTNPNIRAAVKCLVAAKANIKVAKARHRASAAHFHAYVVNQARTS
jgi:hypothetical protein